MSTKWVVVLAALVGGAGCMPLSLDQSEPNGKIDCTLYYQSNKRYPMFCADLGAPPDAAADDGGGAAGDGGAGDGGAGDGGPDAQ